MNVRVALLSLLIAVGLYACVTPAAAQEPQIFHDGRRIEMSCTQIEAALQAVASTASHVLATVPDGCVPGEPACIAQTHMVYMLLDMKAFFEALRRANCSAA